MDPSDSEEAKLVSKEKSTNCVMQTVGLLEKVACGG